MLICLLIWGSTVGLHTFGIIPPGMYIASPMIAFRFKQANNLSIQEYCAHSYLSHLSIHK